MTRAKMPDIRLKEAAAKFTKAKAAVDGTAGKEKAYRKAKTDLAVARQAAAETRSAPSRDGNGQAKLTAVAAKAKPTRKG